MESANVMLKDAGLSKRFWVLATRVAAYLRNRGPVANTPDGKAPEEIWTDTRLTTKHLRVFGCKAYVHIPDPKRDKLDDKAWEGIFVGYTDSDSIWKIYNPTTRKVVRASSVDFVEELPTLKNTTTVDVRNGDIAVQELGGPDIQPYNPSTGQQKRGRGRPKKASTAQPNNQPTVGLPGAWDETPSNTAQEDGGEAPEPEDPDTEEENRPRRDGAHYERDRWGRGGVLKASQAHIAIEEERNRTQDTRFADEWAMPAMGEIYEPSTYEEAISDPVHGRDWIEAIIRELKAHIRRGTFKSTRLPEGRRAVGSKWVFKVKYNEDRSVASFKARLVAQGFSQQEGIDFDETYSPTVRYDTLRLLFAIAALYGLVVHQVDVDNAYLAAQLDEEIYMRIPEGLDLIGGHNLNTGDCLRILLSLYGLKQAARQWNETLIGYLKSQGYVQSNYDPCVMFGKGVIIAIYVDDLLIFGDTVELVEQTKAMIKQRFDIKDLGEAKRCLGINIRTSTNAIKLDQSDYARNIVKRFGFADLPPASTPMDTSTFANLFQPGEPISNPTMYREAVGSLIHLCHTRPDIVTAVNIVGQFVQNPHWNHWAAIRRIFQYLNGTLELGIKYQVDGPDKITGYSDSDYGGDKNDRKSRMGWLFMLAGGPIGYCSRKMRCVAKSTTEAEYVSISTAACHAIWLSRIYAELLDKEPEPILIYGDNQGALDLIRNPKEHPKTKHIAISYHHIRDEWKKGTIDVKYTSTNQMLADGLTKPLPTPAFKKMMSLLASGKEELVG